MGSRRNIGRGEAGTRWDARLGSGLYYGFPTYTVGGYETPYYGFQSGRYATQDDSLSKPFEISYGSISRTPYRPYRYGTEFG